MAEVVDTRSGPSTGDLTSTAFQAAGWEKASVLNVKRDNTAYIQFTIENKAHIKSFLVHYLWVEEVTGNILPDEAPWSVGPGSTITQTFIWEEPLPSGC